MDVYLEDEYRYDREKATKKAQELLYTTVHDVASISIDVESASILIECNGETLRERGITIEEIRDILLSSLSTCKVNMQDLTLQVKPKRVVDLQKLSRKILAMRIKGIPGIKRVFVVEKEGEWIVRTDGSNLAQVLEVEGVDSRRTVTNHIHEIAKVLGIEAARNAIIKEGTSVLEEQGLDVDIRHIMLVADIMTWTGRIRQIGRHGVSGEKESVLARAAFELTVPNLVDAAVRGLVDPLVGVTENIIVGRTVPIGTGTIDLFMAIPERSESER
jgi:DNA-directed RNA polymerase subunit A''